MNPSRYSDEVITYRLLGVAARIHEDLAAHGRARRAVRGGERHRDHRASTAGRRLNYVRLKGRHGRRAWPKYGCGRGAGTRETAEGPGGRVPMAGHLFIYLSI